MIPTFSYNFYYHRLLPLFYYYKMPYILWKKIINSIEFVNYFSKNLNIRGALKKQIISFPSEKFQSAIKNYIWKILIWPHICLFWKKFSAMEIQIHGDTALLTVQALVKIPDDQWLWTQYLFSTSPLMLQAALLTTPHLNADSHILPDKKITEFISGRFKWKQTTFFLIKIFKSYFQ